MTSWFGRRASADRGIRLLVDARALHAAGIGRYLREVLSVVLSDGRFSRITLLGDAGQLRAFVDGLNPVGEVQVEDYPGGFYSLRTQVAWLARTFKRKNAADVAFFPHYDAPLLFRPRSRVVAVHDLTHFKVPEGFAWWRRAAAGLLLRRAVHGARRVVTGSEAARRDLEDQFSGIGSCVSVIPYGCSPVFTLPCGACPPENNGRVDLHPFLLCVGNRKPHKNLIAAVEVMALLRQEWPDLRLVFAGRAYRGWERVLDRADELRVRDQIVDLQEVSDRELQWLYAHCEALLFPSLYEGFGLPIVEAMASGGPVIASDRASIPEVVADAGVVTAPDDYPAMAASVLRLSRDLPFRALMVERGRNRSREFVWEHTGHRTVSVLCDVADDRKFDGAVRFGPRRAFSDIRSRLRDQHG